MYAITFAERVFTIPVLTITAKAPKLNSAGDGYVTDGYTHTDIKDFELINDEGIVLAVKYSEDGSKVKVTAKAAEGKAIVKNTDGADISNKYHIVFADSAEIENAAQEVGKTAVTISAKDPKFVSGSLSVKDFEAEGEVPVSESIDRLSIQMVLVLCWYGRGFDTPTEDMAKKFLRILHAPLIPGPETIG